MNRTSSEILEYQELKALVGRYIAGPLGRHELERLEPSVDRAWLEQSLAELAEAIEFNRLGERLPLTGLVDSTMAVSKLRIEGADLDGREIADLITFLDRASETRSLLLASPEQFPLLHKRGEAIADFRGLLRDVGGKINPNGTVADDASVALRRLRRDIEKQQRFIHESLERFLRAHRDEGVLQEEYVTLRNDRYVVPVVAGQRRRVDGVIHGASGSGQTLFVEPLETIDLNNELVRLTEEEAREVARILREITERLRSQAAEIRAALGIVGGLDLLFAKAGFASAFDCVIPKFMAEGERRLHIKQARHPLLQDVLRRKGSRVVPVSLTLDRNLRTLLISGPNTGGKTVSMKTAGLLVLMAQSAMPVPADEAEFSLFDQVLADVGDNQSIEQSLSTFSAHIACIKDMIETATPDSLILLDELGRATDPEEGGALGVAILDHFRTLGCITLASTHLLALKVYGANTPGVLNASMGFDDATLQPTYVLRTGAPGKSAGIDIATRLGLPTFLIERARAAMTSQERDLSNFLNELHSQIEKTRKLEIELRDKIAATDAREKQLERDWEKRESAKLRELEQRFSELIARFDEQAKGTIEQIQHQVESRKAVEQAARRVAKTKRELREQLDETVRAALPEAAPVETPKLKVEEGRRVIIKGIRQPARVRRILDDGSVEVDAGLMKMRIGLDDIQEVLPGTGDDAKLPKDVTYQPGPRWDVPFSEINIIGQRAEEACDEVERFLDRAAMASVERVRIVHGHGMGILKRAINDLLKRNPHVATHYPASPGEGGSGATIAELKG
ncbi:MAG TPA: Smr/MutS family protein [Bryobacteraceae bacterium]|nr:Smr/MutS family protein [Bryobacteraceae bacterium]